MADEQTQTQSQPPPTIQPPPGQAPPVNPTPPPGGPEANARMWNMWCHLSALSALVGVPFGNIIGPLIIWQIKKNEIPSVDFHGKASLNFQITVTIVAVALGVSGFILSFVCIGYALFPLAGLVGLAGIVFAIIAGIKANNGEDFKYPWSLELIK